MKDIVRSISFGNRWQPNNIRIDNIKEVFLAEEWNSFHVLRKKQNYLRLKDFPKYKCEVYLKQPLTPPQRKIIATAPRTIDWPLKLDDGRPSLALEILDYATFAPKKSWKWGTFRIGMSPK